jgi:cysteine desulfurase
MAGSSEPSHVLTAMGYPPELARGALRFSLGHETTAEEIDRVVQVVPGVVAALRGEPVSA